MAQTLATSAVQKQHQLDVIEQQFSFNNNAERDAALAFGRQEVITISKQKLECKMEMLHLIIMKRQEGIQKESSMHIIAFYYFINYSTVQMQVDGLARVLTLALDYSRTNTHVQKVSAQH